MSQGAGIAGPGGHAVGALGGTIDAFDSATGVVRGWAVDSSLAKGGWAPVVVKALVDGHASAAALALEARPDLVNAGVAPNPEHGFSITLPASSLANLTSNGTHSLELVIVGSPGTVVPRGLPEKSKMVCVNGKCL